PRSLHATRCTHRCYLPLCRFLLNSIFLGGAAMPLFEVETESHIIITWAADQPTAQAVVEDAYPGERVVRFTRRPRDTWVISKGALGLSGESDICHTARDCLSK